MRSMAFSSGQLSISQYERQPRFKRRLKCTVSIRWFFFLSFVVLSICILLTGLVGFSFYLRTSIDEVKKQRRNYFTLIFSKIEQVLSGTKLATDSLGVVLESRLLNFSEVTYEELKDLTFEGLETSFDRLGLNSLIIYSANGGNVDQFISYWKYVNGDRKYFRRYKEFDNTTAEELVYACLNVSDVGDCNTEFEAVDWDSESSITHQAIHLFESTFVEPYLFFCPGDLCDIFLAYAHPFHTVEGDPDSYYGVIGVAFESSSIKKFLQEYTVDGMSFIVDLVSGYMISTSSDDLIHEVLDGVAYQITALDHPSEFIARVVETIKKKSDGNLSTIRSNEMYQMQFGFNLLDYQRYQSDGADWLIVKYTPSWNLISLLIVLAFVLILITGSGLIVSFVVAICGGFFVIIPLKRLFIKMEKLEILETDKISKMFSKYSIVKDIAKLERQFFKLVSIVEMYRSFLPAHLVNKGMTEMKKIDDGGSCKNSDSDSDSIRSTSSASVSSIGSAESLTFSESSTIYRKGLRKVEVTLVYIGFNRISGNFIPEHIKICEFLTGTLFRYKGIIIKLRESFCMVGFNIRSISKQHLAAATNFALEIVREGKRKRWTLTAFISCGECNIGVLGCTQQKIFSVEGELNTTVTSLGEHYSNKIIKEEQQSKYFGEISTAVLCDESTMVKLWDSNMTLKQVDVCLIPKTGRINVYELLDLKLENNELMYRKDFEEKRLMVEEVNNLWRCLFRSGVAETKVKIKEMEEDINDENLLEFLKDLEEREIDNVQKYVGGEMQRRSKVRESLQSIGHLDVVREVDYNEEIQISEYY